MLENNYPNEIILTVQSCGKITKKKYRLGIGYNDSRLIFKKRKLKVMLEIEKEIIETSTTCGHPLKKGFDLYHFILDRWIKDNSFSDYIKGSPTKLIFQIVEIVEDTIVKLKFKKKLKIS